jgi:hypothetical protein
MQDLTTCEREKTEYRVVLSTTSARKAVGCDKHGFVLGLQGHRGVMTPYLNL